MRYHFKVNDRVIEALAVIIYTVGIAGLSLPSTKDFFIRLIPLVLGLSLFISLLFHNEEWNPKIILVFSLIIISTWLVEAYGVATGKIFGIYVYGNALGVKILDTPVLIGFNWLFLVYGTACIVSGTRLHVVNKALLASILMVIYDFFLEFVAPDLKMWKFENATVPFRNYLAWFIISFALHSIIRLSGIKLSNRIASFMFLLQLFFFIILSLIRILR